LVIKNCIPNYNNLYQELLNINYDKKAFMRGRVVNKIARYNVCFADISQSPDYEAKKGTIVNFADIPLLQELRSYIEFITSDKLLTEANYYYNRQCGIGYHKNSERHKVVCCRFGEALDMHFQWYYNHKPVGENIAIPLEGGDIYIMSHKAVGNDWHRSKICTLRHATGNSKYTTVTK